MYVCVCVTLALKQYARTPPIQNLGETEVAWEKNVFFLVFWEHFFIKKRARGACGLKI